MSELKYLMAKPSLKDVTKLRLDEINKIKDYLNAEIKERKDIIKKISKYIVAFDYAQTFYYTICIVWHFKYCITRNNRWNTCRIAGASLTVIFTVTTGIVKIYWGKSFL